MDCKEIAELYKKYQAKENKNGNTQTAFYTECAKKSLITNQNTLLLERFY